MNNTLVNTPRTIFQNTVALFITNVGYQIGNVFLVFYLSRLLQAQGLGAYSTAITFFGMAELITELGLSNFIPRELAKDLRQTNHYWAHTSTLVLGIALLIAAALAGATPYLGYSTETVTSMYLVCLAILPTSQRVIISAIFTSHQKAGIAAFNSLFWAIARILASIYLLYHGYGVVAIIVALTVTTFLSFFSSLYLYVRYIDRPHWEFDFAFFKDMLGSLKAFVLLALGGSIFNPAETIILSLMAGETPVGIYSAAFKLVTVWYLVPQSYMSVVFPVLTQTYHHSPNKSQILQERSIKYLLAVALPLTIGGFAAAAPIVNRLYGPGFEETVLVFRVLTWLIVLTFVNNVLWRILLSRDEQYLALRVQVITGVLKIALSVGFIAWLGAVGAAWAIFTSQIAYTIMHVYYVRRKGVRIPFIRLGWRFALAAAVMGVFTMALSHQLDLFLLVPLAALVYAVLVFLLRAFSSEDLTLFRRVWQRSPGTGVTAPTP